MEKKKPNAKIEAIVEIIVVVVVVVVVLILVVLFVKLVLTSIRLFTNLYELKREKSTRGPPPHCRRRRRFYFGKFHFCHSFEYKKKKKIIISLSL